MGRYPVDVTTILVGVHVATMVAGCLLIAFGGAGFLNWLAFDSRAVLQGYAFHELITYAFVHPPISLLWFAVEMYVLFAFGREVERFLGRKQFITLYSILLLGPTILLTIWGLRQHVALGGSMHLHFGVFIAFATLYPRAELMFRILAKWAAIVLAAISTLQYLAYHEWPNLVVCWFSILGTFFFIEARGAGPELAWIGNLKARFKPKPKLYIVQKSTLRRAAESDDVYESIDPILDKISNSGMSSLTENEKKILDRARNRLLKKSD